MARGTASRHASAFQSYVGEGELAALYARAAVFVFLSEYEGFGLTPLEALSAGVPVVVLDTRCRARSLRRRGLYVPPATSTDGRDAPAAPDGAG